MERKFYTNDFEQLLKENADQFKMSPSKKVWHGIYNDIHPGRRWPSIAMSLLFVATLIIVGYLNIDQSENGNLKDSRKNVELQKLNNGLVTEKPAATTSGQKTGVTRKAVFSRSNGRNKLIRQTLPNRETSAELSIAIKDPAFNPASASQTNSGVTQPVVLAGNANSIAADKTGDYKDVEGASSATVSQTIQNPIAPLSTAAGTPAEATPINTSDISIVPARIESSSETGNLPDKRTSDYGIKTKRVAGAATLQKPVALSRLKIHKNPRISWAYYLSPGISYRNYSSQGNVSDQLLLGYNTPSYNTSLNSAVTHHVALGLEAGTAMKYAISKKLKFTSGFQVNYSAYTIQANNIHPIIATLILHDEKSGIGYPFSSISYFGNGPGNVPVNLHNYSVQLSTPIGLEYEVGGNEDVQFSVAGSIQPSLVLVNKAYILSTDRRNYLTDASLNRDWNIGTNIGTFISFNSNKLKWQIGPQIRYQLLSSYGNEFLVREHFIDYNIRFAISRSGR